ncbi:hypothetical protein GF325_02050 [Candidatus Bathyarchaeota archaeon]|nr:hypothetical protein [Candidatus Bathyarchaeota archaeon]
MVKIKEATSGENSLFVDMRRIHKKLSKSLEEFEENIDGIEDLGNTERKQRIKNIATTIYEVIEDIQDLNFVVDDLIGDDLIEVDGEALARETELVDVVYALVNKFESSLKNFHKTYYNRSINENLKLLTYNDFQRSWHSLERKMQAIIDNLDILINDMAGL